MKKTARLAPGNSARSFAANTRRSAARPAFLVEELETRALLSAAVIPTDPTFLAVGPQAPNSALLALPAGASSTDEFAIFRSTDGVTFTQLAVLPGKTTLFKDSSITPNVPYSYWIQRYNDSTVNARSPLAPPSAVRNTALSSSRVEINWSDSDSSVQGYYVLRFTEGTTFNQIAKINSANVTSFVDLTVNSGTSYKYQIKAYNNTVTSLASSTVSLVTPLIAPTGLTATIQTNSSVKLAWTNHDAHTSGYYVLRAVNNGSFLSLATVNSASTPSYTDTNITAGNTYSYVVRALSSLAVSPSSANANATAPITLTAPTNLNLTVQSATSITLAWNNSDPNAVGFIVLRSADGIAFTQIAKFTSNTTYTDTGVVPLHSYTYRVQSYNGSYVSPYSNTATATTPLTTPTGLTAAASTSLVSLSWSNSSTGVQGYYIYRAVGSGTSSLLATTTTTATTYADTAVTADTGYTYQVRAYAGSTLSGLSNTASAATPVPAPDPAPAPTPAPVPAPVPAPGPSTVTVATRYTNELTITTDAASANTIYISQSGSTLTITANGSTSTAAAPAAGLFIYARGGTNAITVDASVTLHVTIEAIDGSATTIASGSANVSAWIDSTDTLTGSANIHRVASFYGGVAKTTGAALANPTDAAATTKANLSLFGTGPVAADVNQGAIGDCYFLSAVAAYAIQRPGLLVESAVDMGDGTYAVQFARSGVNNFLRVSNDFSTGGWNGFRYAHPGANNTIWAAVLEKAFTYFRSGTNTYASISGGWMSEVYNALGKSYSGFTSSPYATNETGYYNLVSAAMAAGKAVTAGTITSPPNLVGNHAYTIISAAKNSAGVTTYVVRNPWGTSGDALENGQGYATLTFAQMISNFVMGAISGL